jgi:hypothetical protein
MNITTMKRRLTALSLIALAVAPYSAVIGMHLIAKTQPQTCEQSRDLIIGGDRPPSFGTVTKCYAWGWWEVSSTLQRD